MSVCPSTQTSWKHTEQAKSSGTQHNSSRASLHSEAAVLQHSACSPVGNMTRALNTAREFFRQGPYCQSGGFLLEFATESFRASYIPKARNMKCRLCCPRQCNSRTLCYLYRKVSFSRKVSISEIPNKIP